MKALILTLLVGLGVSLTIVADVFLKKSQWYDWQWVVIGFFVYGLVAIPVALAYRYTDFGRLFLIWEAVAVIFGLVVASWYYKEPFSFYRFIALILALGALYFSYK